MSLDEVYGLSQYEKLIILGYRPRVPAGELIKRLGQEKPAHRKRPAPFLAAARSLKHRG